MAIIKKAYGRAPERFYFIGGSQGGHEALDAAARYSNDYDGVVANYPAYNVTLLHLGSLNAGRALYEGGGAAWINPAKTKLITDAVYAKCDRARWRQGRPHQRRQGVQQRVRREDAAMLKRIGYRRRLSVRCAARGGGQDHQRLQARFRDCRHGYIPALGAARRRAVPGPIELRPGAAAVQSAVRQGAVALYRAAIRPPSSSSRAIPSSIR